jgi:hypothetical protein
LVVRLRPQDCRWGGTRITSEQFSTAGRSVRTGLTACGIVSKWTWPATVLLVGVAARPERQQPARQPAGQHPRLLRACQSAGRALALH